MLPAMRVVERHVTTGEETLASYPWRSLLPLTFPPLFPPAFVVAEVLAGGRDERVED